MAAFFERNKGTDSGQRKNIALSFPKIISLLRLHQWVKNLLIFAPTIMAHKITTEAGLQCLTAFLSFGLCASATYIVNDFLDLRADRLHPEKKKRPLAAGTIPIGQGLLLAPLLLAGAFLLASRIGPAFLMLLLIYVAITSIYSLALKKLLLADVVTLAILYALRIFAGALAVAVPVSSWLLIFAIFFFFSLALVKRYTELLSMPTALGDCLRGRAYASEDRIPVLILGIASGCISVLVLTLYISSDAITLLYRSPQVLWLICPLILCWIGRIWLLANRGLMTQDPIVFAVRDPSSYILGALATLILLGAALV